MINYSLFLPLIIACLIPYRSLAQSQDEGSQDVVYLKDGGIQKGQFAGVNAFQKLKLLQNGSTEKFQLTEIDSLEIDQRMFQIVNGEIQTRTLIDGYVTVKEGVEDVLSIQTQSHMPYAIPIDKLNNAYRIFCTNGGTLRDQPMSRKVFLSQVRDFNIQQETAEQSVLYDSRRQRIQPVVLRIGVFLPEVGLEFGIAKWLSLYNGFGVNFLGNVYRNARTVINFDATSHLRIFPGFKRRLRNGNHIYKNSGFYLGPFWSYAIELGTTNVSGYGMACGWQDNNFLNKASGFTSLGLGYDPLNNDVLFLINIWLGVAF